MTAMLMGGIDLEDEADSVPFQTSPSDTIQPPRTPKTEAPFTLQEINNSGLDLMGYFWTFNVGCDSLVDHWALAAKLKDEEKWGRLMSQKKAQRNSFKNGEIQWAKMNELPLLFAWNKEVLLVLTDTVYPPESIEKLLSQNQADTLADWKAEIAESDAALDFYASGLLLKSLWNELPLAPNGFLHAKISLNEAVEADLKLIGSHHLARKLLGGVQEHAAEKSWHQALSPAKQAFSIALRLNADTLLKSSSQFLWFQSILEKVAFIGEVLNPVLQDWDGRLVYQRMMNKVDEPEKWRIKIGMKRQQNAQQMLQDLYQQGWLQKHQEMSYHLAGLYRIEMEKNDLCWTAPLLLEPEELMSHHEVDKACVAYLFLRPAWLQQSTWNMVSEPLPEWFYSLSWLEMQVLVQDVDKPYAEAKLKFMPSKKRIQKIMLNYRPKSDKAI
jgi:hypothetical protein